jgi:hypothetical protein
MTPALDRGRPKARPRPNQLSLPESPLHEIQAVRLLENGLWLVDRGRRFPKDVATLGCSGLGAFPGSPAPVGKVAGPSRIDLLTLVVGQCRQIVKAAGHVWVLRAQGHSMSPAQPFPGSPAPAGKGLGLHVLTLIVGERRQIVEAGDNVWVLGVQSLFPDRQRSLVKGLGFRVLTLVVGEVPPD